MEFHNYVKIDICATCGNKIKLQEYCDDSNTEIKQYKWVHCDYHTDCLVQKPLNEMTDLDTKILSILLLKQISNELKEIYIELEKDYKIEMKKDKRNLQNAHVGWQDCETGAPEIDPKRPYGNSSVASDVIEILGFKINRCPHCNEIIDDDNNCEEMAMQLHKETETALQIILKTKSFKPGIYVKDDDYTNDWRLEHEN